MGPGRIDPQLLSPRTREAILELQRALAGEPYGFVAVQVTMDGLGGAEIPPTVDVRYLPSDALESSGGSPNLRVVQ